MLLHKSLVRALLILTLLGGGIARAATQTQLTFGGGREFEPRFSPTSDDVCYADGWICIVNAAGGSPACLDTGGQSYAPAWFPDGQRLVYMLRDDLYVRQADGTIIQLTMNPGRDDDPFVTPDGQWIYFVRNKFTNGDIWRIHPDGTGQGPVIAGAAIEWTPSISPTGTALYYSSNATGTFQIWKANLDGSSPELVTAEDGFDRFSPSLSPSANVLVYTSDAAGYFPGGGGRGVFLCLSNGSNHMRISSGQLDACTNASWSRDGSMIVFEGGKYSSHIYLLTNIDGTISLEPTTWTNVKTLYR